MPLEIPIITPLAKFVYAMATFSATVEALKKETKEIKENYLERFEKVTERINVTEKTIIEKMNENHIELIDRINSRQ